MLGRAPSAPDSHPYLVRKGIKGHGAKLAFGKLAIPLYAGLERLGNEEYAPYRHLVNVQLIDADGNKRFLKGGRKAVCFWWIGPPSPTVCIAEGFATAASVLEATGNRCFIAFDAGNLPAVALAVRGLLPGCEIVLCAGIDRRPRRDRGGRPAPSNPVAKAMAKAKKPAKPPKKGGRADPPKGFNLDGRGLWHTEEKTDEDGTPKPRCGRRLPSTARRLATILSARSGRPPATAWRRWPRPATIPC